MISAKLKKYWIDYWWVIPVVVAAVNICLRHYWTYGPLSRPDVASYFHAWDVLRSGTIDTFRTPLYPVFIGICRELFPGAYVAVVIWLQTILYLCSICFLCAIARRFIGLPRWASIAGVSPYLISIFPLYNFSFITDGPGVSLFIIFCFMFLSACRGGGLRNYIGVGVLSVALVALRPSFVFVAGAMGGMMIFYFLKRRMDIFFRLTTSIMILIVAVGCYAVAFRTHTGYWGVSAVGELNDVISDELFYTHEKDTTFVCHVEIGKMLNPEDLSMEKWDAMQRIASDNPRLLHEELKRFDTTYPGARSFVNQVRIEKNLFKKGIVGLNIPFVIVPLMAMCYLLFAFWVRRKSTINGCRLFLSLLFWGNFAVVVWGAPDEYQRLMMPVYPLFFLMMTDMFYEIGRRWLSVDSK